MMDTDDLLREIQLLKQENARLKKILQEHSIPYEKETNKDLTERPTPAIKRLSPQEKVKLFTDLFCGRQDVFAKRWFSKATGKSGYQPVCKREWDLQYCNKKKYRCAECPNRLFKPLSYDDIFRHLAGKDEYSRDVIGMYAILKDNTCNFLCTDFDDKNCEHGYKDDVLTFTNVCKGWGIPAYIERSRSGNGAHVWIFFSTPISTVKARKMGNSILTEAMNRDGKMSFKSYDRFFPNQDQLPEGGFGNLIALPLQGGARKKGNSVFVNNQFEPFPDQWDFLLNIKKMDGRSIDFILHQHCVKDTIGELSKSSESKPWETPTPIKITKDDFPKHLTLTKANLIYISLKGLAPKVINHLKRIASFKNPEFYKKQALHFSTYDTTRIISCAEMSDDYIGLPRGCEDAVTDLLTSYQIGYRIEDKANHGHRIQAKFKLKLRREQVEAQDALLNHDNGVLSATTAFGKTIIGVSIITKRKVNTLILVHSKALLDQWKKHLEEDMELEFEYPKNLSEVKRKKYSPIGTLYAGRDTRHGIVDIALIQSCISDGEVKSFVKDYGMIIADECHHVSAVNFEHILRVVNARYVYGFTATPIRKDGHQPIIFMQCGPIRYTVDVKAQMAKQNFRRYLIPRFTTFRLITDDKKSYTELIHELAEDEVRNKLIIEDVSKALAEGRTPIILTSLKSHADQLSSMLQPICKNVILLVGSDSTKNKRKTMEQLANVPISEPLTIVATGKYVGEGFDYPRLDTLFLAMPVSWKGIIAQYAGRLHRDFKGKKDVRIYDYIDIRVPLFDVMYHRRLKGYSSIGYQPMSEKGIHTEADLIYNGNNYENILLQDLQQTKKSVVIACPRMGLHIHSPILPALSELIHRGIEIVIFTREDDKQTSLFTATEYSIIQKSDLSINCIVIDKKLFWYGNVNYLGYNNKDANTVRIEDQEIAAEILEILYK